MRNVYLVSRKGYDSSTNIQLVTKQEAEESIPRELGIKLSSLFMYDKLVFVEGLDEDVIREWASICSVKLTQPSIGFVSMGGVRNFTHYATKKTIEFLCKRRVLVFFMLDHDERDEDEINTLKDKLGNKGQLIVLKKRELENYLLCPRAIGEFIKEKYKLEERGEKDVDVGEIQKAINKCVDELKNEVIQRRVIKRASRPLYLDHKALSNLDSVTTLTNKLKEQYSKLKDKLTESEQELETIIVEETQWVETNWETSKLDIVPGDLLLDNVCKSLGKWRFDKVKDSARLASHMKENEIDLEIKNILQSFAKVTSTI
jgi:hypothetical protein